MSVLAACWSRAVALLVGLLFSCADAVHTTVRQFRKRRLPGSQANDVALVANRACAVDRIRRPRLWQHVCKVGGPSEDKTLQIDRSGFGKQDGDELKALIESAAERCADQIAASLVRL